MTASTRHMDGFVPSFILMGIAQKNPAHAKRMLSSLVSTADLWSGSPARKDQFFRFAPNAAAGTAERLVYDAKEEEVDGTLARREGDAKTGDTDVDACYDAHGIVRDYLLKVHGCNSIDANGMAIIGTVNYGKGYNNAFWNSARRTYGKGDGVFFNSFMNLNVGAHEITHGRTEFAVPGGIAYHGQQGAINERISDVFAFATESWYLKQSAKKYHFLVGKGLWVPVKGEIRDALRNGRNPGTAFKGDKIGRDMQPAHMKNYVRTWSDNGGVHINSGIVNKLFCVFADSIEDAKMGDDWESTIGRAAKIVWAARPNLGNNPSFAQLAYWEREACGIFGKDEAKLRELYSKACEAVGLTPDRFASDDLTPDYDNTEILVSA